MSCGRLIIMRHGQTQYNVEKRMTGHRNVPLTEEGRNQAKRAGTVLRQYQIDVAYSSTLDRAHDTLTLALDSAGSHENLKNKDGSWNIRARRDLMEKDVGDFAGHNFKTCPKVRALTREFNTALPNGESDADVVRRVKKLYEEEILPLLKDGKTVVVSCHSVVKLAFHVVLKQVEMENIYKTSMPNAQPWVIEYDQGTISSTKYCNPEDHPANDNDNDTTAKRRPKGPKR